MRWRRYPILILVLLAISLTVSTFTAAAATVGVTGTIDSGDPTMPVVFISSPNCLGLGFVNIHYETYTVFVDTAGVYSFDLTSTGEFASIYLYEGSFDPANGTVNCVAADNSSPINVTYPLTVGTPYIVVVFDDTFEQTGGDYSLTISGPGNISFSRFSGCTYPLPANAVVYDIPLGAPAFFEADLSTQVNFNLPAGTWHIIEFRGDFAKVWIACQAQPIWVPANAVGEPVG